MTSESHTERALRRSERWLRAIIENEPECVKVVAPGGELLEMNPSGLAMLEVESVAEVNSYGLIRFVLPEYRPAFAALHRRVMGGESGLLEFEIVGLRGAHRWLETHAVPIVEPDSQTPLLLGITRDITERKQAERGLSLAASVFTHSRESITITDAKGTIIEVNEAFTRLTGYAREEVLGKNPRILSSGRQSREFYADMWADLIEKGYWYGEIWNRRKNGEMYAQMLTISAVRDAQGQTQQYVALSSDITALKEHGQKLEYIAHYDALTTLPNRVLLADRLQQAMTLTLRREQPLAVAYLDLDGFKTVNDRYGHQTGDQLLVAVAAAMKEVLREGDTLARLGGDEFVAVLVDLENVEAALPILDRLLAAASRPMNVEGLELQVSASLGVAFYPEGKEVDADQLLRQADQAMYQAKLAGKNRYHLFDAVQDSSIRSHHESVDRIRRALGDREFVLRYQPRVDLFSGRVVGAEALIRWRHPDRGLLLPAMFLSTIEEHPLAVEVGEWVIESALRQIEVWQAGGLDLPVSVNVGARQLQQAGFVERLRNMLAAHPLVRPSDLELEVLETSALQDLVRISSVIAACGEFGVTFTLDDFGTGYSSLTYLKRLPVARLKIDQSFVRDMLEDPDDLAILEGVLGMAAAFRREVVAEGVETPEQGAMLLQLGCRRAQGFGIAPPMPPHEVPAWAAAWRADPSWGRLPAVNRDDLPLLFASARHRAWIGLVEGHLSGGKEALPPLDHHQCHIGRWLDGKGLARYGGHPAFQAIGPLHRDAHALVTELLSLESQGRSPEARARLGELHAIAERLIGQFGVLCREAGAGSSAPARGLGRSRHEPAS
ncbi:MAG: EAL domain-containing protein [Vicinamibacteria bacterium]|nr:EAL domain-containing protein [Vicinamibacteria bacterium]